MKLGYFDGSGDPPEILAENEWAYGLSTLNTDGCTLSLCISNGYAVAGIRQGDNACHAIVARSPVSATDYPRWGVGSGTVGGGEIIKIEHMTFWVPGSEFAEPIENCVHCMSCAACADHINGPFPVRYQGILEGVVDGTCDECAEIEGLAIDMRPTFNSGETAGGDFWDIGWDGCQYGDHINDLIGSGFDETIPGGEIGCDNARIVAAAAYIGIVGDDVVVSAAIVLIDDADDFVMYIFSKTFEDVSQIDCWEEMVLEFDPDLSGHDGTGGLCDLSEATFTLQGYGV